MLWGEGTWVTRKISSPPSCGKAKLKQGPESSDVGRNGAEQSPRKMLSLEWFYYDNRGG